MIKACELKQGMVVEINHTPHLVRHVEAKKQPSRGAAVLYRVRLVHMHSGQPLALTFKAGERLRTADCTRAPLQYLGAEGDRLMFMNLEDHSRYGLNHDEATGLTEYLAAEVEGIVGLLIDGALRAIELPESVSLTIVETSPASAANSTAGACKPARLNTGLEVQVPVALEAGDRVQVSTLTGQLVSGKACQ